MDEEQAINSIGKDIFLVDYRNKIITKEKVVGVVEVSPIKPYQYKVVSENAGAINTPCFSYNKALSNLVRYYEARVDVAMQDLNEVLEMETEPYDS